MGKMAIVVLAIVSFFLLGVGSAAAAEKAKPSPTVTNTPTGKALNDLATGNQPADNVFDGRKGNPPPVQVDKSTSTRTPQQAIDDYKKSGPPPGVRIKPAPAPPPPPRPSPPPPPSPPPKKK